MYWNKMQILVRTWKIIFDIELVCYRLYSQISCVNCLHDYDHKNQYHQTVNRYTQMCNHINIAQYWSVICVLVWRIRRLMSNVAKLHCILFSLFPKKRKRFNWIQIHAQCKSTSEGKFVLWPTFFSCTLHICSLLPMALICSLAKYNSNASSIVFSFQIQILIDQVKFKLKLSEIIIRILTLWLCPEIHLRCK